MPATTTARTYRAQRCPGTPHLSSALPPRAFLDLGAVRTSPRCARAWTREILREWHLADLRDDAEAVVAELVANAVHASAELDQPVVRLALIFDHGELAILVSDRNPDPPQPQQPTADAVSGRGLLIIQALSHRYGWCPLEGSAPGKVVFAVLRTPLMHPATALPSA